MVKGIEHFYSSSRLAVQIFSNRFLRSSSSFARRRSNSSGSVVRGANTSFGRSGSDSPIRTEGALPSGPIPPPRL